MKQFIFGMTAVVLLCVLPMSASAQTRHPKILNGIPVTDDDFDAVGIVGSVKLGGFCTGTLIGPRHVLTAAHCAAAIKSKKTGTFQIAGRVYRTSDVRIHEDYNKRTFTNDIAILILREPVTGITPAMLYGMKPESGDVLTIVGYGGGGDGDSGDDGVFGVHRYGTVKIDEVDDQWVIWEFDSPDESNAGFGDSGGPGFLEIAGEMYIASIVSWGTEPDAGFGDVAFNTRVDLYTKWINDILKEDEDSDDTTDRPGNGQGPGFCPPGHRPPGTRPGNRPGNHQRPGNRPGNRRPGYRPGNHQRSGFDSNSNRRPGNQSQWNSRPGRRPNTRR